MTKKLTLRISKFEKAVVAEQVEICGEPLFYEGKATEHCKMSACGFFIEPDWITFGYGVAITSDLLRFNSNKERDEYIERLVGWITDELFGETKGGLKIGEYCEVRDDDRDVWQMRIYAGKLARELGDEKRVLAKHENYVDAFIRWKYVRPIAKKSPLTINGEYYTWEV